MTGEQYRAFHDAAKLLREEYGRHLKRRDQAATQARNALHLGQVMVALEADVNARYHDGHVQALNTALTQVQMIAERFGLQGPLGTSAD